MKFVYLRALLPSHKKHRFFIPGEVRNLKSYPLGYKSFGVPCCSQQIDAMNYSDCYCD